LPPFCFPAIETGLHVAALQIDPFLNTQLRIAISSHLLRVQSPENRYDLEAN